MSKKVLITGILGQDGANMAEYLLETTDNLIYGMQRRSGSPNFQNIKSFIAHDRFSLVDGDLTDSVSINDLVLKIQPDYLIRMDMSQLPDEYTDKNLWNEFINQVRAKQYSINIYFIVISLIYSIS